jgi:general secretion pathway protein K
MPSFKFLSHHKTSDGFIVVAVLWILGALATLAAIYALYVHETTFVFVGHDERLQAQELALAGVEVAAYQLTAIPAARPSQGKFSFRLGNADVAVTFRSENSRIDLNLASKQILAGLFTGFGARREDAEGYADRILAWRTPQSQGATDSEAAIYHTAGRNFGPRHAPFQHVNELGLVLGLPSVLIDRALPFLTVYSGQAEVNLLNAAPEVLAALPGMTPERLHNILLGLRDGAPQDILTAQLGMAAQYATVQPGRSNRVTVDVRFDAHRQVRSEAVILLRDEDTEPFRVLSWRDEDGELSTDERSNTSMR